MNASHHAIDTRLRPFAAMAAVRKLLANPEDTSQIFVIFRALRGRSGVRSFSRFKASPAGQRVLAERRVLLERLNDRAGLAALPEGSTGRAYLAFMEAEKLSAEGLVAASQSWEDEKVAAEVELFRNRMRDAHDLTHVLTGYGRDGLGELCLLAYMHRHSHNLGQLLIVAMSWSRMPAKAREAVIQAWRNGAKAQNFQTLDYEAVLARPLDDVRRELGISEPTRYREIA